MKQANTTTNINSSTKAASGWCFLLTPSAVKLLSKASRFTKLWADFRNTRNFRSSRNFSNSRYFWNFRISRRFWNFRSFKNFRKVPPQPSQFYTISSCQQGFKADISVVTILLECFNDSRSTLWDSSKETSCSLT